MAEADVDEDDWMWAWLIDRLGLCLWYGKERKTIHVQRNTVSQVRMDWFRSAKGRQDDLILDKMLSKDLKNVNNFNKSNRLNIYISAARELELNIIFIFYFLFYKDCSF